MKYFEFSIFAIAILSSTFYTACEIIKIEDGKLKGTTMKNRSGSKIYAFLKVPFAEPPIDNLRFQPPIKNKKWEGIRDATQFGPPCMQYYRDWMSEDCLYLNVFTKSLDSTDLKPVIVYIHGGGYVTGASSGYYPEYLLDRDVVLVTINYRLGPFGFLATGSKLVTGNMGLKDQVMALKWIQKNIKVFGGNPKKVTITGSSAGAFSVTAHLASKMSAGLFHRAFAMSGSITYQTGLGTENIEITRELSKKLNCPTEMDEMISCLTKKSAMEITLAAKKEYLGCLVMPWFPVVEVDIGQERFFTDQPNNIFKDGHFTRVPIIIGITADEFIGPVKELLNNEKSLTLLNKNFTQVASKCFFFKENGVKTTEQIANIFRKHYLPYDKIDKTSFNSLQQLCADGTIGYGIHRFVRYASTYTDVYYYKFSYMGRFSSFNYPRNKPYGVHHGDDNQYVMASSYRPKFHQSDPENFMVERMTRIWEQFAITGNPNNPNDIYLTDMNWPKYNTKDEYYLDIGMNMVEKQGLYLERYLIWDSLENNPHRKHLP